jgi:decaprenylphospho-beta-D-ribofuranose 2-oxidase
MAKGSDWPPGPRAASTDISFDGSTEAEVSSIRPDSYRFFNSTGHVQFAIPRGAGLSYAPAFFDRDSVSIRMNQFKRILDFDSDTGQVEVEAGISLFDLHSFLSPKGYYLPVQPGHGRITVGGCIAPDVHGKNQYRDGTFIQQVASLKLFHPFHGIVHLSRESEADLFRATCGGYGLTGIIVSAVLQAKPIRSQKLLLKAEKVGNCQAANKMMTELADESDLLYSWHDFSNLKSEDSPGYVIHARFKADDPSDSKTVNISSPPRLDGHWRRGMPLTLANGLALRAMNTAYKFSLRSAKRGKVTTLDETLFPIHGREIYYRLFGKKGFHEYQALLPHQQIDDYLQGLKEIIRSFGAPVFLASGKHFGGSQDLLRFSGEGTCFAINIPRRNNTDKLLAKVDDLLLKCGGKPNIIKDSRLTADVVRAAYPEFDKFKSTLREWDSKRLFRSELSERLDL